MIAAKRIPLSVEEARDLAKRALRFKRDNPALDWRRISFHQGWLWVDMGKEGPNHASFSNLMTAVFFVWVFLHPEVVLQSYVVGA